MYAIVTRRRMNPDRMQETRERASREFWPKVQQLPGFVSFTLILGDDGINTSLIVWESKAHADAFHEQQASWSRVLEEFGHRTETHESGEVMQHLTASR